MNAPHRRPGCQLLADVLAPLPLQPGQIRREDNEYKRNGTAVVLLAYDGTGHPAGHGPALCPSTEATHQTGLC